MHSLSVWIIICGLVIAKLRQMGYDIYFSYCIKLTWLYKIAPRIKNHMYSGTILASSPSQCEWQHVRRTYKSLLCLLCVVTNFENEIHTSVLWYILKYTKYALEEPGWCHDVCDNVFYKCETNSNAKHFVKFILSFLKSIFRASPWSRL